MSSILSTSACGVGTQTTSFPAWPTSGWYSLAGCDCATPQAKNKKKKNTRRTLRVQLRVIRFIIPPFLASARLIVNMQRPRQKIWASSRCDRFEHAELNYFPDLVALQLVPPALPSIELPFTRPV